MLGFLLMVLTGNGFIYAKTTLNEFHLDGKIVGGKETMIEEHPYQLSLEHSGRHFCGASLIKPNIALTAAHCTHKKSPNFFTVRGGSTLRGKGGDVTKVIKVCQHPKFSTTPTVDYDVSVLLLDRPFKLSKDIREIPLQLKNVDVATGAIGVVTGWGTLTEGGSAPSKLQAVEVPRVDHERCEKAYTKEKITKRMVCFGYVDGGKDSCQGDSGGPLVVEGKLVGVVSWGYGCAQPQYPGVYANVADADIHDHIGSCLANF